MGYRGNMKPTNGKIHFLNPSQYSRKRYPNVTLKEKLYKDKER